MKTLLCQTSAFVQRDFVVDFTYRLSFAIGVIDALGAVGAYYLLSTIIGIRPGGYEPFAFILTGLVMNSAMSTAMACYAQSVRDSQQSATLPLLVASPVRPSRLIVLSSAYPLLRASSEAMLFLGVGLALGVGLYAANLLAAVIVFLLSLAAFSAVGILSAACIVVWKRGDPIPWLIGAASWLFGGVFFPIDRLPDTLQALSRMLPIAYALEAFRPALLEPGSFRTVLTATIPLAAFTLVVVPLSLFAFSRAIDRARREGTLRQY